MFRGSIGRKMFRFKGLKRFKSGLFLSILSRVEFYALFHFFSSASSITLFFVNLIGFNLIDDERLKHNLRLPAGLLLNIFPSLCYYAGGFKRLNACLSVTEPSQLGRLVSPTDKFNLTFLPESLVFLFDLDNHSLGSRQFFNFVHMVNTSFNFFFSKVNVFIFCFFKFAFFALCRLITNCVVNPVFVVKKN